MSIHFAYIILAHKEPEQVAELVAALAHPDDHFFIHIDNKVKEVHFGEAIRSRSIENVHFVNKRENGQWGGLGIVKATLNALHEVSESGIEFCHVHLLSGQDFPIKPNEQIRSFFAANRDSDFIEYEAFPVKHLDGGGWHRLQHYSWTVNGKRLTYLPKACKPQFNTKGKILNTFLAAIELVLPKRELPNGLRPYYGSQWWSLSGSSIHVLLDYLKNHPNYIKFHNHSLIPDEMFFQTLIMHFSNNKLPINDNKRFILWEEGSSHPVKLTEQHLEALLSSRAYFARKFERGSKIISQLI